MKTKLPVKPLLKGVWHNQHNSEIQLEIDQTGKISGSFITGVMTQGHRSETFPLTGFAGGDVFAFCVDFSKHGCMTTWVGQIIDPASKRFHANWQMIADVYQKEDLEWKSTWVGQDVFDAGPRETEVSNHKAPASHPMYSSII
ncbi:MAG TPA: avidin/streptavidin family protein [Candidatus Obscuribacterales bacterium]